jgi:hypothetical protein
MRIVPFPQPPGAPGEPTPAELEAALHGDAVGPSAEYWRDLRADVRALAPPLPPGLEQRLRERIEARAPAPARHARLSRLRAALVRGRAWLAAGSRHPALAGVGIALVAAIVTLAFVAPWNKQHPGGRLDSATERSVEGSSASAASSSSVTSAPATARAAKQQLAPFAREVAPGAPARIQQRAASLTLAAKPSEVQSLSDRVAQLAVREGGVVQSSQVHLESGTAGEANLRLSLPSAHLSAALAAIARLAPTRAESQQLQDITDEYDAAKRKLSDAVAERQALLRALSRASTQGAIESLHARLSLASGAITSDREAFASISKRGSNANVEVSVIGDAHAASGGGLSVSGGLHDAGDVLRVSLAVLLIALAVLVPLAILAALLLLAWRGSRRRLRERALS